MIDDKQIEAAALKEFPDYPKDFSGEMQVKPYLKREGFVKGVEWYRSRQQKEVNTDEQVINMIVKASYELGRFSIYKTRVKEWLKTQTK